MLKGKAALVGMARALPALMRIAKDADSMRKIAESGTDDMLSAFAVIVENHADDLMTVLAALAGRDPEEYAENATVQEQLHDMTEVMNDNELMGFFASARGVGLSDAAQRSQSASTAE